MAKNRTGISKRFRKLPAGAMLLSCPAAARLVARPWGSSLHLADTHAVHASHDGARQPDLGTGGQKDGLGVHWTSSIGAWPRRVQRA